MLTNVNKGTTARLYKLATKVNHPTYSHKTDLCAINSKTCMDHGEKHNDICQSEAPQNQDPSEEDVAKVCSFLAGVHSYCE